MATDVGTRTAIDDVFDDNFSDLDFDPFADRPSGNAVRDDKAVLSPRSSLKRKSAADQDDENFGLGLDEEVKIVKKRKPIAKLDEARLLSEPGIPVLRTLVREKRISRKLKLKGKGHEFTDAARLLNYYQLWLDNLYPRAKFADALQLVEKAGHTKRMQLIRNEWINESKPGYRQSETSGTGTETRQDDMPDLFTVNIENTANGDSNSRGYQADRAVASRGSIFGNGLNDDSMFVPDGDENVGHEHGDEPDEDDLDALLALQGDSYTTLGPTKSQPEESEGEDDLDALLAEQDARQNITGNERQDIISEKTLSLSNNDDEEDDDLEALLAEQDVRTRTDTSASTFHNTEKHDTSRLSGLFAEDDNEVHDGLVTSTLEKSTKGNADSYSANESNTRPETETEKSPLPASPDVATVVAGEDSQLRESQDGILSSSPIPNV